MATLEGGLELAIALLFGSGVNRALPQGVLTNEVRLDKLRERDRVALRVASTVSPRPQRANAELLRPFDRRFSYAGHQPPPNCRSVACLTEQRMPSPPARQGPPNGH